MLHRYFLRAPRGVPGNTGKLQLKPRKIFTQFAMDDFSSILDSLLLLDMSKSLIDSNGFATSNEDMTSRDEQEDMTSNAETTDTNDPMSNYEDSFIPPSKLTVFVSYLSLMQYSLRHGLTKQAFIDLLGLVGRHIPTNSMVSLYTLRKFFQDTYGNVFFNIHYCCTGCHVLL